MPYLTKDVVTVQNTDGETLTHNPGIVLSDWEVSDYIRGKIAEGSEHYRKLFETLTDSEAFAHRVKATRQVGAVTDEKGDLVEPPFEDYVGLHPQEVVKRMRDLSRDKVAQVRAYEKALLNRVDVMEYVAPCEQQPWIGYDESSTQEITEKLAVLSQPEIADAIAYEMDHRRRPAIIEFTPEEFAGVGAFSPPVHA